MDPRLRSTAWLLVADQGFRTVRHIATCAAPVAIAYILRDAISDLAGKTTLADIGIKMLVSTTTTDWILYVVVCLALLFGVWQRQLRKRTIRRMAGRIAFLEHQADPSRSSSQLTSTGDTRQEDQ